MAFKLFPYPLPKIGSNHYLDVRRWLDRNGFRYVHQMFVKRGRDLPDLENLTAWLWDLGSRHASGHLDFDKRARLTEEAAVFVLSEYSWDAPVYRRARAGGAASSTAIQISDAQLLSVRDLSHSAAAEALGVSKSTIQRRRRTWDATSAELDSLFGTGVPETAKPVEPTAEESEPLPAEVKPQIMFPQTTVADGATAYLRGIVDAERAQRVARIDHEAFLDGIDLS